MRRDRKLAKQKKARVAARTSARGGNASSASPVNAALQAPFGPAFIAGDWRTDEDPPELLTVVLTRRLPNGLFVAHLVLIDRTCLGVKDATVTARLTEHELGQLMARAGSSHRCGVEEVSVLTAQSIVFSALDYAAGLGFQPQRDFVPKLIGARPEALEATAFASRGRPYYCPGPYDDARRVIAKLEAAVGARGFDVAGFDDELDDDADLEDADDIAELAPDEKALRDALEGWLASTARDPAFDFAAATRAYAHAVLGNAPHGQAALPREHVTSLPLVAAAFFQPLQGGGTGIDRALAHASMRPHREALSWLAQTRARFFEVLAVDLERQRATCRDVLADAGGTDDALIVVRLGAMATKVTRWMRFFGLLTPMPDGSLYAPSALFGSPHVKNVDLADFFQRLNRLVIETGGPENAAWSSDRLTRFAPIAHGLLSRMAVPTREETEEAARPLYLVNADGDRFEPHEASLRLPVAVAKTLANAISKADDFANDGDGEHGWLNVPGSSNVLGGERAGNIRRDRDGSFVLFTNSSVRHAALLARLSTLAGTKLTPARLDVMRPWEHHANAVAEETPESRRVVCASKRVRTSAAANDSVDALKETVLGEARRALDEHVPLLGGRPRELVASGTDGRQRVERWLADWELRGTPGETVSAFLDLDGIRSDLGLERVADRIAPT